MMAAHCQCNTVSIKMGSVTFDSCRLLSWGVRVCFPFWNLHITKPNMLDISGKSKFPSRGCNLNVEMMVNWKPVITITPLWYEAAASSSYTTSSALKHMSGIGGSQGLTLFSCTCCSLFHSLRIAYCTYWVLVQIYSYLTAEPTAVTFSCRYWWRAKH